MSRAQCAVRLDEREIAGMADRAKFRAVGVRNLAMMQDIRQPDDLSILQFAQDQGS